MDLIETQSKKEDCAQLTTSTIAQARSLVERDSVPEAVSLLLYLEKKTRISTDNVSCARVVLELMTILCKVGRFEELGGHIRTICRKRGQSKHVLHSVIRKGLEEAEGMEMGAQRRQLVETLLSVSEGKIFAELERARLRLMLSGMREQAGDVRGACDVLLEMQVETVTSMDPREMSHYILNQMRLCLACADFRRAAIISRKLGTDHELRRSREFLEYLCRVETMTGNHLEAAKTQLQVLELPDCEDWRGVLSGAINSLLLADKHPGQHSLFLRISGMRRLETHPLRPVVEALISPLIISFRDFTQRHGLEQSAALMRSIRNHNMSVIAGCYSRVRLARVAQLLGLGEEETEECLSEMVGEGRMWARIDRIGGVVEFVKRKSREEVMNRLEGITYGVMRSVAAVVHQIDRDYCG